MVRGLGELGHRGQVGIKKKKKQQALELNLSLWLFLLRLTNILQQPLQPCVRLSKLKLNASFSYQAHVQSDAATQQLPLELFLAVSMQWTHTNISFAQFLVCFLAVFCTEEFFSGTTNTKFVTQDPLSPYLIQRLCHKSNQHPHSATKTSQPSRHENKKG